MLLKAINPYNEMIRYELLWEAVRNSSLKKIMSVRDLEQDFSTQEKIDKIKAFFSNIKDKNFSILTNESYQFPKDLKGSNMNTLYYEGDVGLLGAEKKVSIVGARKASNNGIVRAKRLAKELVENGYIIVSGLAEGIDTSAMQSAIDNKGYSIGVIGTPINEYYPIKNKDLQDNISKKHLLISHVPFYKYAHQPFATKKFYFPERNTIMAAISQATIIVEASDTSGSLTQARACLDMGRKLFILNSCFESSLKWPHTYEKRGAVRVRKIEDILENL